MKGQREWLELLDSDPATLYGYLKFLEQYQSYEYTPLRPKYKIETWDDVERFIVQVKTGSYFSSFSSEKTNEHPHSLEKLQSMVDQLLKMVSGDLANKDLIKGGERKSMLSQDAEKFSIREILCHVRDMSEEERSRFTYEMAWNHVREIGEILGVDGITKTMVRERAGPEAKQQLMQMGIIWKQKGGRPKKNQVKSQNHPSKLSS